VSAQVASPAAKGSGRGSPADPVRALQHALYRAAKADPGRRFHALYDKVRRRDVSQRAWVAVRSNNGAPGIDRVTLAAAEEYGVDRLLGELAAELEEGRYRPLPARRVYIPKPGCAGRAAAAFDSLDRPGDVGGSDPWKDAESCLHSGSTPMSCVNAR
jgi:RNA-directed DNA polymerase